MDCPNRCLLVLLLYSSAFLVVNGIGQSDTRLQFLTEPVSQLSRADGSRITFKCTASPPEANIRWLRNGSIIKNDEFEWIKVSGNKLVLNLHKSFPGNSSNSSDATSFHQTSSSNEVYQCLAELGSQVIVSQPANLIIAELHPFGQHDNKSITVIAGNTAVIPCDLPQGVPFVISEFEFANITIARSFDRYRLVPSGSLQILNAKQTDSGAYRCVANNPFLQEKVYAHHFVNLKVVKSRHAHHIPRDLHFVVRPKEITSSILGQNITIECVANSHPVPKIYWERTNGLLPKNRNAVDSGNLHITVLEKDDEGTYICKAMNGRNTISASTSLEVAEIPQIIDSEPYEVLEIDEGQDVDLSCEAKGFPRPFITWLHNGYIIDPKDAPMNTYAFNVEEIRTQNLLKTVLQIQGANAKLHNGSVFQCFVSNNFSTIYITKLIFVHSSSDATHAGGNSSPPSGLTDNSKHLNSQSKHQLNREEDENVFLEVDQDIEQSSHESSGNHHNHEQQTPNKPHKKRKNGKNLKLIPPNNPVISKLSDDSVMVRWSVSRHGGVPINFFKVQYREAGKNEVNTVDDEISSHIFSYSVGGLNSNAKYRFRIAAVYQNDDNAKSNWTKFHFPRNPAIKKPTLPPTIVAATARSSTEVLLQWNLLNMDEVPIDGFFIDYRSSDSAGEYVTATSIGAHTRQHNLAYLSADKTYEIKMRCFNPSGTSDFSNIYTIKTLPLKNSTTEIPKNSNGNAEDELNTNWINHPWFRIKINDQMQKIVIAIVISILTFVIIVCLIICVIRCKNQPPASKVIQKGKSLKANTPSDYYFNSTNTYDRRTNRPLASVTIASSRNSLKPPVPVSEADCETKPLNMRLNQFNEMSSLNRKNSFRSSLSSSTHHLFNTANGKSFDYAVKHEVPQGAATSTATIDRARMMTKKTCVDPYLDYPRVTAMNHHSVSITRLNGTLERKRRSRNDLSTLDRSYLRNNFSVISDIDRQPNGNATFLGPQNVPIVIMQSSC